MAVGGGIGPGQVHTSTAKPGVARETRTSKGEQHGKGSPAGIRPSQAAVTGVARTLAQAVYVDQMPLYIQAGFRRKMLTLLLLQLCTVVGVGLALRSGAPSFVKTIIPNNYISVAFAFVLVLCLPLLARIRDKYPYNHIATGTWTLLVALCFASAHMPIEQGSPGWIKSNVLFFTWSLNAVGVFFLIILSAQKVDHTPAKKRRRAVPQTRKELRSFAASGFFSWFLMAVAAVVWYRVAPQDGYLDNVGMFMSAFIMSSILHAWISFDAALICEKMEPQEYWKTTIYFYTDFIYLCCVCMCWTTVAGLLNDGPGGP